MTLVLDDLLRKLLTYEIHLKDDEEETQTTRGEAVKTTSQEHYASEDEPSEGDEDSKVMIARGLKKIFK